MSEIKDVLGIVEKLSLEPVLTPVLGLVDGAMGILNSLAGPGSIGRALGVMESVPLRKMISGLEDSPLIGPIISILRALSEAGLVDMVLGVLRSEYVVKTINFIVELLGRILSPISSLVQRLISVIKPLMSAIGRIGSGT